MSKKIDKAVKATIKDLDHKFLRKSVSVAGLIEKVVQTGGPTVFTLSDGTGILSLKGFISPGERAYKNISSGDYIKATVKIDEFQGELEGNIDFISKLNEAESNNMEKVIRTLQRQRAKVTQDSFMVEHVILDKLKERFINAAEEIRLAIIQNRPIIVRHHNDCDGYSSGFALERAILPLIIQEHGSEKAAYEYFTRAPCKAPLYELDDSIRDTAMSLRNVAKFSNKMPLIIITDNGSSEDDLMAIKHAKIHGADFIVVDHHGFEEDLISKETLVHINPFLVGESGSSYSAGMLCAELARFINPEINNTEQIPALTGLMDRIDLENPKTVKDYLERAEKVGYTEELLRDIGLVMDYITRKLRFMEAREYIEVMFGEPRDKQRELVSLMAPYVKSLDKKGLEMGRIGRVMEKVGNVNLQLIEIEKSFPGFGFYPNPGRAVSLLHEDYLDNNESNSLVTLGLMNSAVTIRATDEANFSVHELKNFIEDKFPKGFIEGGGHKNAGSLSFLPKDKEKILDLIKEFISNLE